ncbi:MAG: multicopper oxidase domain-containing protein [Chitinophagaceae bacterium]|nr:multicopper oxidase domain-containing protein [Chitinophagaceae bacterium]
MQRKKFIKLTGATGVFTMFGGTAWLLQSCNGQNNMDMSANSIKIMQGYFSTPLPSPPAFDLKNTTAFETKQTQVEILKGKKTNVYGYYDGVLGKTFVVNKGDVINLQFTNSLQQATNIHWHGLIVPSKMDGFPSAVTAPGSTFQYQFSVNQRAGTYWYHPHPDGLTAGQVMQGLAGFFIVRDEEEAALKLPNGDSEIAFVILDRRFKSSGDFDYTPTNEEVMTGFFGDYILVNGAYNPYKIVKAGWNRLRIINGSNAEVYNLAFSNGQNFAVIGSDAGLLAAPETVNDMLISPGERINMLVDFSNSANKEIFLQSKTFDGGGVQGKEAFKILKFAIGEKTNEPFTLPTTLSAIEKINPSAATKTRTFDNSNASMHGGGMMNIKMDTEDTTSKTGSNMGEKGMNKMKMGMHSINGIAYDAAVINETVTAGATEIWEFDNSKGIEIHPMHFHGNHFQVLERKGGRGRLIATEKGWTDTVLLLPGEKVNVITTFSQLKGKYVLHCHNLEHEDSGMMLNFEMV